MRLFGAAHIEEATGLTVKITSDSGKLPVTLTQVKEYLNYVCDKKDSEITLLIRSAINKIEEYLGSYIVNKQVLAEWERAPYFVELPYDPVNKIESVTRTFRDEDTILTASDYYVKGLDIKKIYPNYVVTVSGNYQTGVKVLFQAGYLVPFTVDDTTDVFTVFNHPFSDDDKIRVTEVDTLPTGLSTYTDYYIINSTTDTFQVSLTLSGSAVDVTSAGINNFIGEMPDIIREVILREVGTSITNKSENYIKLSNRSRDILDVIKKNILLV